MNSTVFAIICVALFRTHPVWELRRVRRPAGGMHILGVGGLSFTVAGAAARLGSRKCKGSPTGLWVHAHVSCCMVCWSARYEPCVAVNGAMQHTEQHTRLLRAGLGVGAGMGLSWTYECSSLTASKLDFKMAAAVLPAEHHT